MVFRPPPSTYTRQLPGYLELTTTDGATVPACWLDHGRPTTVLYSHGNACDLGDAVTAMEDVARRIGCNLLLYDYPGYGTSTKQPATERGACGAAWAVWQHYATVLQPQLAERGPASLVLWGTSLGSGPTCYLASRLTAERVPNAYAGVVLESPISSVISTVLPQPVAYSSVCIDSFRNYWHVLRIDRPLLLLHGDADAVVPWNASRTLARNVSTDLLWEFYTVPGAGHNDLRRRMGSDALAQKIADFLASQGLAVNQR